MGRVRALVSLAAATLHQQQRHPWAVAFRTAFASEVAALRSTDGRAAFARTCAPVVLIAGGLCICRPLQEWLRGADGQSFLDLLWMETPVALASAMATAWLVTAPCVSLLHPTRPAGSSDLSVCHAQLAARVALLQSPALLFTIPAVALNPLRLSLLARMAAGAVLALAASAASLLLAEARLTRRVEMLARAPRREPPC